LDLEYKNGEDTDTKRNKGRARNKHSPPTISSTNPEMKSESMKCIEVAVIYLGIGFSNVTDVSQ
jgi:hypothetical protein